MRNDIENIVGIDPNAQVIERLIAKGYKAAKADARKLPFTEEEFEAVHCHNVIEHLDIDTAYALLHEAHRVLKKEGLFILSSEVATAKFWNTFGHVKPYPPEALIKLLREESREEFEGLKGFEVNGLFYIGDYYPQEFLYLVSFILGYLTPLCRREYFLIFKKK